MGADDSVEARMTRAMSEKFSAHLAQLRAGIAKEGRDPLDNPRLELLVEDRAIRGTFRRLRKWSPYARNSPAFREAELAFLRAANAAAVVGPSVPLTRMVIGDPGAREYHEPTPEENLEEWWHNFERMGSTRAGILVEVIGAPGTGKSNFMTWMTIQAAEAQRHVWANARGLTPTPKGRPYVHFVYTLWDALKQIIALREEEMRRLGDYEHECYLVVDEQAGSRGGGSLTASTLEARWTLGVITKMRKLGVNLVRARQLDNIPAGQREMVCIEVRKERSNPGIAVVNYLQADIQGTRKLEIPDMRSHYTTRDWGLWDVNVDTELLDRFLSAHIQEGDDLRILANGLDAQGPSGAPEQAGRAPSTSLSAITVPRPTQRAPNATCLACGAAWYYRGRKPRPDRCNVCRSEKTQLLPARAVTSTTNGGLEPTAPTGGAAPPPPGDPPDAPQGAQLTETRAR